MVNLWPGRIVRLICSSLSWRTHGILSSKVKKNGPPAEAAQHGVRSAAFPSMVSLPTQRAFFPAANLDSLLLDDRSVQAIKCTQGRQPKERFMVRVLVQTIVIATAMWCLGLLSARGARGVK